MTFVLPMKGNDSSVAQSGSQEDERLPGDLATAITGDTELQRLSSFVELLNSPGPSTSASGNPSTGLPAGAILPPERFRNGSGDQETEFGRAPPLVPIRTFNTRIV